MTSVKYIPEVYWDRVARQIGLREGNDLVAGDDEPFYTYKRIKFLELLNSINFTGKKVLEVGSGPGGNLLEIDKHRPAQLYGTDISGEMISLSEKNIGDRNITILKTSGSELPFAAGYFDIIITATVLQHITDEKILAALVSNMCRVAASDVYIFERIERKRKMTASNTGRTVEEYVDYFNTNGFRLECVRFSWLHSSYVACGIVRKVFNRRNRSEAESVSSVSTRIQKIILPVTKKLDKLFKRKRDLAMLHFTRSGPGV